jgi:hypothetical protein
MDAAEAEVEAAVEETPGSSALLTTITPGGQAERGARARRLSRLFKQLPQDQPLSSKLV